MERYFRVVGVYGRLDEGAGGSEGAVVAACGVEDCREVTGESGSWSFVLLLPFISVSAFLSDMYRLFRVIVSARLFLRSAVSSSLSPPMLELRLLKPPEIPSPTNLSP